MALEGQAVVHCVQLLHEALLILILPLSVAAIASVGHVARHRPHSVIPMHRS